MDSNLANTQRSMFVIYDTVAQTFNNHIFIDRHPAPVCRTFHELLGNKQTQLATHPADYNLMHIGFIEDDGTITPIQPLIVATGSAWLALTSTENPAHVS